MKLKFVASAVLIATASVAAQADGDLGPLAAPSVTSFSTSASSIGALINDLWTFQTSAPSYASATATSSTVVLTTTLFGLDNFVATLDGNQLSLSLSTFTSGPFNQTIATLSIDPILIDAGPHIVTVSGLVTGEYGGGYSGSLTLSPAPIPEPETYAMMLAGLGALGFLARRRQS